MVEPESQEIGVSRFRPKLRADSHLWIEIYPKTLSLYLKVGIDYPDSAFNIGLNIIIVEKIKIVKGKHIKGGNKPRLVVSCYPYIVFHLEHQWIRRLVMPYLLIIIQDRSG